MSHMSFAFQDAKGNAICSCALCFVLCSLLSLPDAGMATQNKEAKAATKNSNL